MNYGNLKTYVAAYINRDAESFVQGGSGIDLLGLAINDAKRTALRKHNFSVLKSRGFIVASTTGTELSTITTQPLSQNPSAPTMLVKKIESCWQFEAAQLLKIRQIPFILESDLHNIIPMMEDAVTFPVSNPVTFKYRAYVRGTKLYVSGLQSNMELLVDVTLGLPDYVASGDTDFLSERYPDWLLFRSLMQLNAYLKETERIQVSKALLDQAWEEILQDDNERVGNHNSANSLE